MEAQIIWTGKAIVHLNNIFHYISGDSEIYAHRFIRSLILSVESQLIRYPFNGRAVPEFQKTELSFLKEIIFRGYRIIYNPAKAPGKVVILAVLNGRMDVVKSRKKDRWVID